MKGREWKIIQLAKANQYKPAATRTQYLGEALLPSLKEEEEGEEGK